MMNDVDAPRTRRHGRAILIALAVLAADIAVGQAAGWANSGKHDPPGQILVFWIFLISVLTILVNTVLLGISRLRRRNTDFKEVDQFPDQHA